MRKVNVKTILKVFSVDFISKVVMMLITIYLIRIMNQVDYAKYSLVLVIVNTFNSIVISSFGKIYIVDNDKYKRYEKSLLVLIAMFCVAFSIVLFWINSKSFNQVDIFFVMYFSLCNCIFSFSRIIYQSNCNFTKFSLLEIVRVFLFAILLITTFILKINNVLYFIIVIQGFPLIIGFIILLKDYRSIFKQKIHLLKLAQLLLSNNQILFFVYAVLMSFASQLDLILLNQYSTTYYVAAYSSGLKYYNIILMVSSTINSVMLPMISKENDYDAIKKMYKRISIMSIFLGGFVIIGLFVSPYIIPILDGGKYPEAIDVYRILSISAWISFIFAPYNNLVIKENKILSICVRNAIGIVLMIILSKNFINMLGVYGMAITSLITYAFINITGKCQANRIFKRKCKQ